MIDPYITEMAARIQAVNPDARSMPVSTLTRMIEIVFILNPERCFSPARLMGAKQGAATLGVTEHELLDLISIHNPQIPIVNTKSNSYYRFGDLVETVNKAAK